MLYICSSVNMRTFPAVSLCISTYNWPSALALCLDSILRQTHLPVEVVIGDDGSGEETRAVVDAFSRRCPVPVRHIWQPDDGFRLAQIRNKSFAASVGEYIIQADGDLVFHPRFVEDHLRFAQQGRFLAGTRSLLNEPDTKRLIAGMDVSTVPGDYQLQKRYNAWRNMGAAHLNYQLQKGIKQVKYVLGANMSFWRKDLLAVNGYNEAFTGWGKEDNDLAIRLSNAGIQLHFLKFAAIVYHMYHKEAPKDRMSENELLLAAARQRGDSFVANGLNKYLN